MVDPIQFDPNQQISRTQKLSQNYGPTRPVGITGGTATPSFADTLAETQGLRFSNHAQQRLEKRQLELSDDGLNRLTQAVDKADKKGGKSSLVLMDDMAFIVNVRERMVVTAMDANAHGEGVFTQIDTVVFAEKTETNGQK
jgi:flagellar operon protein